MPIGRGVDGMVHDHGRHLVVTANGVEGTMSVIRQEGTDGYRLAETVVTRAMARVVALDGAGRLFSVTAGHSVVDGRVVFHRDGFGILTYLPR